MVATVSADMWLFCFCLSASIMDAISTRSVPNQKLRRVSSSLPRLRNLQEQEEQQQNQMGVLGLTFSFWHPTMTAKDATTDNVEMSDLVNQVLDALDEFLCQETDFSVVADLNYSKDLCRARREHSSNALWWWDGMQQQDSIVTRDRFVTIDDGSSEGIRWTTWSVVYNIVQVGEQFKNLAASELLNYTDSNNNQVLSGEEVQSFMIESSVTLMGDVAQLALDVIIREGTMDLLLYDMGARTSIVGNEVNTFKTALLQEGDDTILNHFVTNHAIRIIGAIMFVTNLVVASFLMIEGRRRRIQRDLRARMQEKEKKCDLVTDEGVDSMLKMGRKQSMEMLAQRSKFILESMPRRYQSESAAPSERKPTAHCEERPIYKSLVPSMADASQVDVELSTTMIDFQ
jgi:hypothetical protein